MGNSHQAGRVERKTTLSIPGSEIAFDDSGSLLSWSSRGRDIIFPASINSDGKKRGGMFTCLPFLGKAPGKYSDAIPQHGYPRITICKKKTYDLPVGKAIEFSAKILADKSDTWPWSFSYKVLYTLTKNSLSVSLEVTNDSRFSDAMPINPAFHPYFVSTLGEDSKVLIGSKHYDVPMSESLSLQSSLEGKIYIFADGVPVVLSTEGFDMVNLWTDSDLYFCAEPFAVNRYDLLSDPSVSIISGGTKTFSMRMDLKN